MGCPGLLLLPPFPFSPLPGSVLPNTLGVKDGLASVLAAHSKPVSSLP